MCVCNAVPSSSIDIYSPPRPHTAIESELPKAFLFIRTRHNTPPTYVRYHTVLDHPRTRQLNLLLPKPSFIPWLLKSQPFPTIERLRNCRYF